MSEIKKDESRILHTLEVVDSVVGDLLYPRNKLKLIQCLREYSGLQDVRINAVLNNVAVKNLLLGNLIVLHYANGKRIQELRDAYDRSWQEESAYAAEPFLDAERKGLISHSDLSLIKQTFYTDL
ncbi:hypothetical protein ACFL08_00860 [Patescibacteria group bacterium]